MLKIEKLQLYVLLLGKAVVARVPKQKRQCAKSSLFRNTKTRRKRRVVGAIVCAATCNGTTAHHI